MQISGKVVYVDLSGGFWGIEGRNGQQYRPVNGLPSAYRKQGLQVKAKVTPASGMSIFMWGKQVNILEINTL